MGAAPAVENAVTRFNAPTVTTSTSQKPRIYNAAGFEFMTLTSDSVSTRFDSLFGEKLVGMRHARSPLISSRSQMCRWARPYSESEADFLL